MAKTFMQMAGEAMAAVPSVSLEEARQRVRDMMGETGKAEGRSRSPPELCRCARTGSCPRRTGSRASRTAGRWS